MTNAPTTGSPIGWFEIGTPDPDAARAFYGGLFGWTFEPAGPAYSIATTGDGHPLQGGIQDTTADLPEGQPPTYAVPCVLVADVAAACERAAALGGKVVVPATPTEVGVVYGMVSDPTGAIIGVFSPPAGG
jgi:hypothetical protein